MEERRLHRRIPREVSLSVSGIETTLHTVNVSLRGMFIAAFSLPSIGSEQEIQISIANESAPLRMRGMVTWTSSGENRDDFPKGFGVRITWMTAGDWDRWIAFVNECMNSA